MKRKILILVAILAVTCWAAVASADFIVPAGGSLTLTGASGGLSASATFSLNAASTELTVVLTNTAPDPTTTNGNVLTALFFTPSAAATLTPVSANITGATVTSGAFPAGGNVGGEWAYQAGLSGAPLGASAGISSAGFGLFAAANFNGPNLAGPVDPDGSQFGLVATGSVEGPGLGNGNTGPFVINFTTFTLTVAGLNGGNLTLGNVSFQYGTALTEPNVPAVPIPPTALLLGSGLLGIIALGIRRRKE